MGSSRKSRPAVKSPASSFNPSFPALDEDPNATKLDGWIVDEEEYLALDKRLEEEGKVILVVGNPPSSSIELLQSVLSASSLLLLPPPATSTSPSTSPPSSSSSPSRSTSGKTIVHLQASLTNQGIGKVFEEALTITGKWRKGKAKSSRVVGGGSKERRRSVFGLSDQTSGAVGGESGSMRAKNRLSRPVSLMSFSSDNSLFHSAAAARSPPPAPSSNARPIDVVLNFLPTTSPSDPTSLQTLLSSTFLVTTVSLPVLCPKVSNLTHASSPSPPRNRPSSNLSPSSPPTSLRRGSQNYLSVPVGLSASTPSSPSMRPVDLARSRPSSIFSNSDSNPFYLPSEAVLAHILPPNSPPLLPMLLDKFMKPTLLTCPSVGMVILPESILASRPSIFEQEGDSLGGEEEEEQEELEGLSSEESSSSHASSSRNRIASPNGRSPAASPSRLPIPPIISLLLASSLRPPLLLPPSLKSSSRRGSSSSSSSSTFRSSTLNPSTPTPSTHHLLSPPAELTSIRTFIQSERLVTFIPRPVPLPSSSSWSTVGGGRRPLIESLTLMTDGLSSTNRSGASGYETPKLEHSSTSSGSDGGVGTPGGSLDRNDALEDVSVVGSPKRRAGATLGSERTGELGRGGRSSGSGGESWITRFFGSFGRKGKSSRGIA